MQKQTHVLSPGWLELRVKSHCARAIVVYTIAISCAGILGAQNVRNSDQLRQDADRAQADLQSQNLDAAIREYQKILTLDPGDTAAHANIGVAFYMKADFERAAEHLGAALKSQPDLWDTAALLGMSQKQLGKNVEAETHLKQAFAHVQNKDLHTAVGRQLITLYMQAGSLVEAADVTDQLVQANPSDIDLLYTAHRIYSYLAATTLYSMAVLDPESARMYQSKGDELAQQGNMEGAIAAYRQALQRKPNLPGAHYELAEVLSISTSADERAKAEGEYESALAENPLDEKAECGLAAVELEKPDFATAQKHYARAVELEPDDAAANEGLGVALFSANEPEKAKPYLQRAVQLDPQNGRAHYHLSILDRKLGDLDAAKSEMAVFLKLKTEDARVAGSLKDVHGQILTQIQKDHEVGASSVAPQ